MASFAIHPLTDRDGDKVVQFITEHWGSTIVVSRGIIHRPAKLPGFVAVDEQGAWIGLITYHIQGNACEVVTLDSLQAGSGIGTVLIEAVKAAARRAGCKRLWLITTNDNLHALKFYQKRGFALVAVHCNAVEQSRKLKPQIPFIGNDGIPIRDEIELALQLDNRP
jgi:N-acetylglutamate synthase-like GNAT family acetyltransferase